MKSFVNRYGLFLAWLLSLSATFASLALDISVQWPVCTLCWYQRMAIYPLSIMLGIATYRGDKKIIPYVVSLPCLGMLFALYQYLEQMIPGFAPIAVCSPDLPCNTTHLLWLGFVTLPLLSGISCALIVALLGLTSFFGDR